MFGATGTTYSNLAEYSHAITLLDAQSTDLWLVLDITGMFFLFAMATNSVRNCDVTNADFCRLLKPRHPGHCKLIDGICACINKEVPIKYDCHIFFNLKQI